MVKVQKFTARKQVYDPMLDAFEPWLDAYYRGQVGNPRWMYLLVELDYTITPNVMACIIAEIFGEEN